LKLLFAWRYFKSKKSTNAINVIAWISVLAITVGTAALIVVLSVFNGFEDLVKGLYGDFYSDIRIAPAKGKFVRITPETLHRIRSTPGVAQLSRVVEEKAMLTNGEYNQTIVFLKGVDKDYEKVNRLHNHIARGVYETGSTDTPAVVMGVGIENAVRADPESQLSSGIVIYLPNRQRSLRTIDENNMVSANVQVSGSFMVQQEFDNKYAFTNLGFMQYMLYLKPDEYSSLELSVTGGHKVNQVKQALQQQLGAAFVVRTRMEQNQSLFTVMQVEKWVIYGILSLILLVAAFNMIGALTMLVLEKQKDIAVLKAMGANDQTIQGIFLNAGFVLAGVGGVAGMLLAFVTCFLQLKYKLIKLEGGTFIIDYYPVKIMPADFLLVAVTILFITVLAAYIPARRAATQLYSLKS
jgi:lipoprotein-releasing system permease protein